MTRNRPHLHLAFVLSALAVSPLAILSDATAKDWSQWRGPDRTGISEETQWTADWPAGGPPVLWRANVGTGFSSFTVAEGRAYTTGNEYQQDTLFCFDTDSGETVWKYSYPEPLHDKYYVGGTSATPTVHEGVVYQLSKQGHLAALSASTGDVLWRFNIAEEIGAEVPTWGFASSPFVHGDKLIVNVGTHGTALNRKTGNVIWTTGKEAAGYSTPVPFEVGGMKGLALFSAKAVVGIDPDNGRVLWSHPWKTDYDVNAADPIFHENKMFVSSGYRTGGALFDFSSGEPKKVWEGQEMHNQFNSAVLIDGHLYGVTGQEGKTGIGLACVEFATGKMKWKDESPQFGALMAADGKLIVMGERGQLFVYEARPDQARILSRMQVLGGKSWTTPVLSNGKIFVRNSKGDVACVDVSLKTSSTQ